MHDLLPGQLCRQLDRKQQQQPGLSTGNTQPVSCQGALEKDKTPHLLLCGPATRSGYHTDMHTRDKPFWHLLPSSFELWHLLSLGYC